MSYYDPDLNKKVLIQDVEQVQQSTRKAREKRETKEKQEYDVAVKEYEKDVASANAQYEKDVAEYNRQVAEAERLAKEQNIYDAEIQRLEAQKQKELADAHYEVWGPGGSRNRSDLSTKQNTIVKNYDSKINKAIESKRIVTGYQEFAIAFPGQILPRNVAETFRSSPSFSLTGLYEQKIEGKAAKAEYQRQASAQTAQNIARKQSIEYHSNIPNIGFISSGLGTERGAAVKPTPDAPSVLLGGGKKATETRRPLINVKTVETIYGGQQIETNPRAFVASLSRQDVDAAGVSTKPVQTQPQSIYSFQNISEVKDPSAIALLEFQSQLKTRTAPSASVYKGILEEQGLKETPLSKRIIAEYSSKPVKEYQSRAEAFGLTEAKGKLWTVTDPISGASFDTQTRRGDRRIAEVLGYQYSDVTPKGQKLEGPWSFGFPKNYYIIPDSFGVPRKDYSGNIIYLESEESALKLSERFANKPSILKVKTPDGELSIIDPVKPKRPLSSSGQRLEFLMGEIEKEQKRVAKFDDDVGKLYHVGLEYGKEFVAGAAFIENKLWEGESLIRGGQPKTRPIKISPTISGTVAEDLLSSRPVAVIPNIMQYEKTYGKGSALGAFGALVTPIPTGGKLELPKFIVKGVRKIDEKLMLAEKWDKIRGAPPATHPTEGYYIGTRQERRIELAKWEALPPSTQQQILARKEFLRKSGPSRYEAEKEAMFTKKRIITPSLTVPKITSEIIIRQPPKILTLTQGQPYNLERDFGVTDLPRMGSKPDLRKGTSIDYNELFGKDKPPSNYHAFIGESKSIGREFQGTRVELGTGVGSEFKPGSTTPSITPPTKPASFPPPSKPKDETIITGKGGLQLILKSPEIIKQKSEFKVYPIRLKGEGSILKIKPKKKKTETKAEPYLFKPVTAYEQQYETVYFPPQTKYDFKTIQVQGVVLSSPQMQKLNVKLVSPQMQKLSSPQVTKQMLKQKEELKTRQILRERTKYKEQQKYKQVPILKAALATKLVTPQITRQITVQIPKLRVPTPPPKLKMLIPDPPRPPRKEPPPKKPPVLLWNDEVKKKKRKESKSEIGFYLGNVPLDRVEGMFGRRREITLGKEKITRTLRGDVRVLAGKPRKVSRKKQQYDLLGFKKGKTKFF